MKNTNYISAIIFFILFFVNVSNAQITAKWQITGPIKFPVNKSGQVNGMGRVSQIVFHPTNANKMYSAGASGGLFISTDGAKTWTTTGTDKLPDMSFASVCVDHTNDQIIYLGSGDANYDSNSLGIWKSIDGGATWNLSNKGIDKRMAVDILMEPANHNILIAATNDGIWKSTDAGANWTVKKSGGDFTMMKVNPADAKMLYAVTRTEFFRSTNFGETWTVITLPATNKGGGRIGVSKADDKIVYVTFAGDYAAGVATPVYRSADAGLTFKIVKPANSYNLDGYNENDKGQGNYNYGMTVDPKDANNVWVCGHCIFNSKDGGTTWKRLTSWPKEMHTDMHQLIYSPHDDTKLFNANDGGVWMNNDKGVGVAWIPMSDGLSCTENYQAGQSPIKKDRMGAGTQDNGELYYDAGNWFTNRGGDFGSTFAYDYQNYELCYYISDNSRRVGVTGGSQKLGFPITQSRATLLEFTPLAKNTAFLADSNVYRTNNLSSNPPKWTKISTINEPIKAMTISPADANVVYVVTNSGKVLRSDNAMAASPSFTNVSAAPAATSSKASIAVIKSTPAVHSPDGPHHPVSLCCTSHPLAECESCAAEAEEPDGASSRRRARSPPWGEGALAPV